MEQGQKKSVFMGLKLSELLLVIASGLFLFGIVRLGMGG